MPPTRVFVALGSNLGDREGWLEFARRELVATDGVRLVRASPSVETEPEGGPPGQGRFLNAVVELETTLGARELLARLQAIELAAGRVRAERNGPRTLDLDLLTFGSEAIDEPGLTVPHPRMEERLFVLEPLARIAPDFVLPRTRAAIGVRVERLRRERLAQVSRRPWGPLAPAEAGGHAARPHDRAPERS